MSEESHSFTTIPKQHAGEGTLSWGKERPWSDVIDTSNNIELDGGLVRPRLLTTTLSWSTQADWDAAHHRDRVVTRDIGAREAADIRLGYDPHHLPYGDDIVAYWPFDEATGSSVEDVIGGHTMSVNGGTLGATGILDSNAIRNGGGSNNATVSYHQDFYQDDFTVIIWTNTSHLGSRSQSWVDTRTPESWDDGWLIRQLDNNRDLRFKVYGSNEIELPANLLIENEWNLMVCVHNYSNDVMKFHVNGEIAGSVTGLSPVNDSGRFLRFFERSDANGEALQGRASDIMYVGTALSDTDAAGVWKTAQNGSLTTSTKSP